jgi:endo-beta-N-acetylglucosaminidase D
MLQRGKVTAQVIWYDSNTKSGELKWQNKLISLLGIIYRHQIALM